jgi:hypothetical protein
MLKLRYNRIARFLSCFLALLTGYGIAFRVGHSIADTVQDAAFHHSVEVAANAHPGSIGFHSAPPACTICDSLSKLTAPPGLSNAPMASVPVDVLAAMAPSSSSSVFDVSIRLSSSRAPPSPFFSA